MRTDIELLETLKKQVIEKRSSGMCVSADILYFSLSIRYGEYKRLKTLIELMKPKNYRERNSAYYFPPFNKYERVRAINKLLLELKA